MKRWLRLGALVIGLLGFAAGPSYAGWRGGGHWGRGGHWHGSVVLGIGPYWWGAWNPYSWYPPPYYYSYPPVVVAPQPQVYVQKEPPAPAQPAPESYWYYCTSAKAYYPYVQTCTEPWVKVPARPQQ